MYKYRNKKSKLIAIIAVVVLCLSNILSFDNSQVNVEAGTQNFETPKGDEYKPQKIGFINGSFEIPTAIENNWTYTKMDLVPGWSTIPVNSDDINRPNWDSIEYHRGSYDGASFGAHDGLQWAELNAEYASTLYQICTTKPNTKVYYRFYHSGRKGTDTMKFYLLSNINQVNTATPIKVCESPVTSWTEYKGYYVIPEGQTQTIFAYQAVGGTNTGNLLDDIRLFTPSFISVGKSISTEKGDNTYALIGEIVTYNITLKNEGECTASKVNLTDVLPDGVEYLEDEGVTVTGGTTTGADFNGGTDTLTVPISDIPENNTVTVSFKVKVTGEGKKVADVIQNQAKVTYNDSGYEEYNKDDYNNVSPVVGFTLKNYQVTGTVWVDGNKNGTIDTATPDVKIQGGTVSIVDSEGKIINDVNGNPLTQMTGNDGSYKFEAFPFGTYKVKYTASGYDVTKTGTGDMSNKATSPSDGTFIISLEEIKKTDTEFVSPNNNIGIYPKLSVAKKAIVSEKENSGTENSPFEINELDTIDYVITVTNQADNTAHTIAGGVVSDTIPNNMQIQTNDITPAGAIVNGQNVTWSNQTFSESKEYKIPVKMTAGTVVKDTTYINLAKVSATYYDEQETNKTYHKSIPSTIKLEKSAEVTDKNGNNVTGDLNPEDTIKYVIVAKNEGKNSVSDFTVSDEIPEGLILVDDDEDNTEGMTTTQEDGKTYVKWESQTIEPNNNKPYSFKVKIDPNIKTEYNFQNTASVDAPDGWDETKYPFKDSNTVENKLPARGSFEITKMLDEASIEDEDFVYIVEYTRPGYTDVWNTYYGIITVPAGETQATIKFDKIIQGDYKVIEQDNNWRYQIAEGNAENTFTLTDANLNDTNIAYKNKIKTDSYIGGKNKVTNHMSAIE